MIKAKQLSVIVVGVLASLACGPAPTTKVYVALEDGSSVAVLDARDLKLVKRIALGNFMAHNVQVAPDGKTVWATAVAMEMAGVPSASDQVVIIDSASDEITARIDVGKEVHPAHVVLTPDSRTAFVTGNKNNELIRIDASKRTVLDRAPLEHGAGAHGARVSSDGRTVWVAEIEGKCVAKVPVAGGAIEHVSLEGQAVQAAVTSDGKWAFASVYDTKKVARIDPTTSTVQYASLPGEAQGPVQIYPTPDGKTLLVADQGLLAGRPSSDKLYFIDIETLAVDGFVAVGKGAHGVVAFGERAYVTGVEDGTVTAVDLASRKVVGSVALGAAMKPNGISVWTAGAGTP